MTLPHVSVIVPTHNRAAMLGRAVASVLNQTYSDLELLVVDDASMDETGAVVASFTDPRVRYHRHDSNRHASAARNTGIAHARGAYIAFLDDDDEWLPAKLAKQVPVLDAIGPNVGLVYCWMDYFEGDNLVIERHPTLRGDVFYDVLDEQRLGNSSTLLLRREVVLRVGGFDESLPRGNDGDYIRRVCRDYQVEVVTEVLVKVHAGHADRITNESEQGLRNAIIAEQAKLVKFAPELVARPAVHAAILRKIAGLYRRLGDQEQAEAAQQQANRIYKPPSLTLQRLYLRLPRPVQQFASRVHHARTAHRPSSGT